MKDIRIDDQGRQRCWNCGGLTFDHKRTARSKAMTVGALATKKKLKCQSCGEYNDVGNAKRYRGPVSKRAAIKAGTDSIDGDGFRTGHETTQMELKQASAERKAKRASRKAGTPTQTPPPTTTTPAGTPTQTTPAHSDGGTEQPGQTTHTNHDHTQHVMVRHQTPAPRHNPPPHPRARQPHMPTMPRHTMRQPRPTHRSHHSDR